MIEYILMVAVTSIVFIAMSRMVREKLFFLWVCEMGPRIQAPYACGPNEKCMEKLVASGPLAGSDPTALELCAKRK